MKDFSMLKMFLSAVATSQVSMGLLTLIPGYKHRFHKVHQQYATGHQSSRGTAIASIGASILGCGMALCGTCPGTINAQLGSGVGTAYYVLGGSLAGSLIFANIQASLHSICQIGKTRSKTLNEKLGSRFLVPAMLFATMEALVVYALYALFPSPASLLPALSLKSISWPAFVSGIGIGLLQIPAVLLLEQPLGASGNLNSILSTLNIIPFINRLIPAKSDLGKIVPFSKQNLLRWLSVVAAVSGGFVSAYLSHSYGAIAGLESGLVIGTSPELIKLQAFIGGMALMVGARIAGGCTSGHGISGFGLLVLNSVAAVPSMFGSAIITAHFLAIAK